MMVSLILWLFVTIQKKMLYKKQINQKKHMGPWWMDWHSLVSSRRTVVLTVTGPTPTTAAAAVDAHQHSCCDFRKTTTTVECTVALQKERLPSNTLHQQEGQRQRFSNYHHQTNPHAAAFGQSTRYHAHDYGSKSTAARNKPLHASTTTSGSRGNSESLSTVPPTSTIPCPRRRHRHRNNTIKAARKIMTSDGDDHDCQLISAPLVGDDKVVQKTTRQGLKIRYPALHRDGREESSFLDRVQRLRFERLQTRSAQGRNNKSLRRVCPAHRIFRKEQPRNLLAVCNSQAAAARARLKIYFSHLKLKQQKPASLGITEVDYGSHEKTLNFVTRSAGSNVEVKEPAEEQQQSATRRTGMVILGHYENQHNAPRDEHGNIYNDALTKITCTSDSHRYFFNQVKTSLQDVILPHPIQFVRVNAIQGAKTLWHTDTMRGATCNLVLFHELGGYLVLSTFPEFKTSLALYENETVIPFSCSQGDNELILIHAVAAASSNIKTGKNSSMLAAKMRRHPYKAIQDLVPHASLPNGMVVAGVKESKLQVTSFSQTAKLHPFVPGDMPLLDISTIFSRKQSSSKPSATTGSASDKELWVTLGWKSTWQHFYGWRYQHKYVGDPNVPRSHVFFRPMRESPTGAFLQEAKK